jgi:hypothetical protein
MEEIGAAGTSRGISRTEMVEEGATTEAVEEILTAVAASMPKGVADMAAGTKEEDLVMASTARIAMGVAAVVTEAAMVLDSTAARLADMITLDVEGINEVRVSMARVITNQQETKTETHTAMATTRTNPAEPTQDNEKMRLKTLPQDTQANPKLPPSSSSIPTEAIKPCPNKLTVKTKPTVGTRQPNTRPTASNTTPSRLRPPE